MKEWSVQVPLAGVIFVDGVSAETEEEAVEKGMAKADDFFAHLRMPTDKNKKVSIEEMGCYKIICEGNICHAPLNEVEAEFVDEYDEDDEDDDDDDDEDGEDDEDLDDDEEEDEEDEEDEEEEDDDPKEV